ncbi:hypothetical protein FACS1894162_2470 [Bacteroidia bacterium]|nr:hypothetical protein FACS1894162_2470 [Bacteroidia bacterium]
MSDNFNSIFVNSTLQILEKRCLTLLSEGYFILKSEGNISVDWDENDISKKLIMSLKGNMKRMSWKIDIVPEYLLYNDDNLPAKEAPRIDFRFSCWMPTEWAYFAEAKILIETDAVKTGRKTKISAKRLHKRYVETGIDNYVSGKYPSNGCLIGYILQGQKENIINSLNKCLSNYKRNSEILQEQSFGLQDFNACYLSTHKDFFLIKHLMFDFANQNHVL